MPLSKEKLLEPVRCPGCHGSLLWKGVADWLGHAGLQDLQIHAAYGWVGTGRKSEISVTLKADIV